MGRCIGCRCPSGQRCGGCGEVIDDGWDGKIHEPDALLWAQARERFFRDPVFKARVELAARHVEQNYTFFRDPHAISEKSPIRSELTGDEIRQVLAEAIFASDSAVPPDRAA